jgi:exonuclease SbcD
MRFIHTADWHLGRLFFGAHLTDDQRVVLEQIVGLARESKAQAMVLAGDVFDRSVPPTDAVALLDDVLSVLVRDVGIRVVAISGNHDSAERLGFGSSVLAGQGLHILGPLPTSPSPAVLADQWGPVEFWPLPFAELPTLRQALGDNTVSDYANAMAAMIGRMIGAGAPDARRILVAHAFVRGATETESERPLSLGGADTIPGSCFQGFHYAALGHLHRAQLAGGDSIRYAGSLMKYSFGPHEGNKGVYVIDMDQSGACTAEWVPLTPRRDARTLTGFLDDIVGQPDETAKDDYIMVSLLDREPILDVMDKIRKVYPNVLHVERIQFDDLGEERICRTDHRRLNDLDLFRNFFRESMSEELSDLESDMYENVVHELRYSQETDS